MSDLNPKLAKQLKDAGFPQRKELYVYVYLPSDKEFKTFKTTWNDVFGSDESPTKHGWGANEFAVIPTSDDIMEELGEGFGTLYHMRVREGWMACMRGSSEEHIGLSAEGLTPIEALVNLFVLKRTS